MNTPTTEDLNGWAAGYGEDMPERPWILTPWDVWMKNPHYTGPEVAHPEAEDTPPLPEGYTLTVPTTIPLERVADMLCCALEGGSTYWCYSFKPESYPKGTTYGHEAVAHGVPFVIEHEDDGPPLAIANSRGRITGTLQLMADKYPSHWADLIGERDDADTGDVFFQLLCFGEVIYG